MRIFTKPTMTGDGWNPTHKHGDDLSSFWRGQISYSWSGLLFDILRIFPSLPSKFQHNARRDWDRSLGEFHFEPFILRLQLLFILRDSRSSTYWSCNGFPTVLIPMIPPQRRSGLETFPCGFRKNSCCPPSALRPNLNQMDPLNTSGMDFHSQIKEGHKTWGALSALMAKHGIVSPIFAGSELGPHVRQWSTVFPSADRPSILEALEHPASAMWGGRASHSTKKHRIKWNQYGGSQTFRSKMSYFFRERDLIKTIQKPSALPVGFLQKCAHITWAPGEEFFRWPKVNVTDRFIWVCLKIVYPIFPMVLLIIIPIKWLFHWEYTLFSDKPISRFIMIHGWTDIWIKRF